MRLDWSKLSATSCVKSGAASAASMARSRELRLRPSPPWISASAGRTNASITDSSCKPAGGLGQQPQALPVQRDAVTSIDLGEEAPFAAEVVAHERQLTPASAAITAPRPRRSRVQRRAAPLRPGAARVFRTRARRGRPSRWVWRVAGWSLGAIILPDCTSVQSTL